MLSTTAPAGQFYASIAKDPALLANGYALITSYLSDSQHNRRDTLLNLLNPNVPVLTLVINIYPLEIFNLIDDA